MAIELIDKIKPKNNGTFPMVDARDVQVSDDERLDAALARISSQTGNQIVAITEEQYKTGEWTAPEGAVVVVLGAVT